MKRQSMRYLTRIYWSDDDEGFVAEVPSLPGCVGVGETQAKALRDVTKSVSLWLKSAKKHGDPIPEPDAARDEIGRVAPFLNISKLALRAGLNKSTLASKLRRQTAFTGTEAKAILKALEPA